MATRARFVYSRRRHADDEEEEDELQQEASSSSSSEDDGEEEEEEEAEVEGSDEEEAVAEEPAARKPPAATAAAGRGGRKGPITISLKKVCKVLPARRRRRRRGPRLFFLLSFLLPLPIASTKYKERSFPRFRAYPVRAPQSLRLPLFWGLRLFEQERLLSPDERTLKMSAPFCIYLGRCYSLCTHFSTDLCSSVLLGRRQWCLDSAVSALAM
jgi:hypothetical protein